MIFLILYTSDGGTFKSIGDKTLLELLEEDMSKIRKRV